MRLIVPNLQRGSSNGLTVKFTMVSVFIFGKYDSLLGSLQSMPDGTRIQAFDPKEVFMLSQVEASTQTFS
jgi:hypothetical protein